MRTLRLINFQVKIHQFDDVFWTNGDTRTAVTAELIVDVNHKSLSPGLVRDVRLESVGNFPRIKPRLKVGDAGPLNWVEGKLKPVHNLLVKRLQPGD